MTMNFNQTENFAGNFKKLSKKYKSLPEDLIEFQKVITKYPLGTGKHFATLRVHEKISLVKARLFCRYLRGSSLRLIYAWHEKKQLIEYIEIYFKGDQEIHDEKLIKSYLEDR